MTKDEVTKLIEKSGLKWYGIHVDPDGEKDVWKGDIDAFAHLVAKHTQEQCAKVCDDVALQAKTCWKLAYHTQDQGREMGAADCAAEIRNMTV